MSGYTLGVLTNTGISEFYMVVLVLLACTYVLLSMLAIFENRLHIICDYFWIRYWNKIRMPWIIGHYIVGLLIFIPMKSFIPEQEPAKKAVFEILTCLPDYVHDAPVFVLAETYTYHLIALVSLLVSGCIEAGIIINCLNFFIVRQLKRKRISRVTLKLQIKFLIVISIQMLVPALLMVIPLTYSWVCIVYNYYNQAIMNIVIAMETMHGLFSTLTMIFIHHPYRTAVFNMFPKWSKRVAPGENTSMFQNGSAFPTIN
uniref:Serpentine Receptor, class H n=2 Tax=Caenorhabditis tropicalis TaxID=1561998 RepID=A0A1I7U9R4_9PELO